MPEGNMMSQVRHTHDLNPIILVQNSLSYDFGLLSPKEKCVRSYSKNG